MSEGTDPLVEAYIRLQRWLRDREATERHVEGNSPDPLERYRARGSREAFEEVSKYIDHIRGLRG